MVASRRDGARAVRGPRFNGATRDALLTSARAPAPNAAVDVLSVASLPSPLTVLAAILTCRRCITGLPHPTARLITLTGPGGAGKTRLALEVARAKVAEGDSRVLFVALAAGSERCVVALAIADTLGVLDATALDLPRRALARLRTAHRRCSSSTISKRSLTRCRRFRISWSQSPRSGCWSPAVPRSGRGERRTLWDHSRWMSALTASGRFRALARSAALRGSGCGTCTRHFASRPQTAPS